VYIFEFAKRERGIEFSGRLIGGLKQSIKSTAGFLGLEIYKRSDWRWSHHVDGYYPVDPVSRWGHGKPTHPELTRILAQEHGSFSGLIDSLMQHHKLLHSIGQQQEDVRRPFWQNKWFENLDPVALIGMLATRKPGKYFEIGSGNSTKFARYTIDTLGLETQMVSIDPEPRSEIDALCDNVIRHGLENCDLELFDLLGAGDVLFFDGSHRVFTNSDVTVFFLEIIPRLKPGVIVHIHDIFLPADYPPEWNRKLLSEQYMLAAMLLCLKPRFKILFPNWYACNDPVLSPKIASLLKQFGCIPQGWSFWLEIV
jgi:hypothetical protein